MRVYWKTLANSSNIHQSFVPQLLQNYWAIHLSIILLNIMAIGILKYFKPMVTNLLFSCNKINWYSCCPQCCLVQDNHHVLYASPKFLLRSFLVILQFLINKAFHSIVDIYTRILTLWSKCNLLYQVLASVLTIVKSLWQVFYPPIFLDHFNIFDLISSHFAVQVWMIFSTQWLSMQIRTYT